MLVSADKDGDEKLDAAAEAGPTAGGSMAEAAAALGLAPLAAVDPPLAGGVPPPEPDPDPDPPDAGTLCCSS